MYYVIIYLENKLFTLSGDYRMKKIGLYILSYLSAIIASVIGLIFKPSWSSNAIVIAVLVALSVCPILLLITNIILSKRFVDKTNRSKVSDMNAFLVSHRNDAEKTAKEKLKELKRARLFAALYTLLIAILAVASATLGGVLAEFHPYAYTLCLIYSGLLFLSIYTRIRKKDILVLDKNSIVISEKDYPLVHALARKAADSVGYKGDIVILLTWDCSASIFKDQKKSFLQLGVILLNVLSEDELYSILLHEFAHIANNEDAFREQLYRKWIEEGGLGFDIISSVLSNIYVYFYVKYSFNYMIYKYASSVIDELKADSAMAKYSDKKIAVSALLKTHYSSMYSWESAVKNDRSIYESEELVADYLTNRISTFKQAILERHEFWNGLVSKEIIANNASHPTLKMRMDALGVDAIESVEISSSDEYLAEIKRILQFSEETIYNDRIKTYKKDRAEFFLEPLSRIEKWNEDGNPISAETYADIVTDLKAIGRHEEAEALCDRVLEQLPSLSSANAAFMKGSAMLYRYDENGMDLIYGAIEQNGNYIEEGLNILGAFCCMTGREKDLSEYRTKAAQLAQKHKDNDAQISFLSKNDKLTKETLPDGMLDEILAYIKSIDQDIIQNIYLVRKTVSDTFFASVFIIHFYGGTNAQRDDIMHKIFRFLDSHPTEWQFSLFDYFEYPEVKVEKIEGSLVFTKDNKDNKDNK